MKKFLKKKWLVGMVGILVIVCLSLGFSKDDARMKFGLGDIPLDPETYKSLLLVWPEDRVEALPASYDARTYGYVTSAKNQGSCGSCWSFASVGAMESHMLIEYGLGPDLSEQQQVSCNTSMAGCCGGSMASLQYWETVGAIKESCFPYGESGTSCPTYFTVPCSGASSCTPFNMRVTNYHTVTSTAAAMNDSLYYDGPSYWRFDVYSDFNTYWNTASAGAVYTQSSGTFRGGHAVLLIGWDDSKSAFLCKNSWGATGGPNGDGTFWIAYTGHTQNLGFGMANFDLTGYRYCFDPSDQTATFQFNRDGMWFQGIATGGACNDGIVKGCLKDGNWILARDIVSGGVCVETILMWGVLPSRDYTVVNNTGYAATGTMVACSTGGQLTDAEGSKAADNLDGATRCLQDDWGNQYNLTISSMTGGKKIIGTRSVGTCGTAPLVTGMIRGDYFSFYVDIDSASIDCNEGYLVICDLSTRSGQWINEYGATGAITFTSCATAKEGISNKPSPDLKKW